jgi:hypothetical protein
MRALPVCGSNRYVESIPRRLLPSDRARLRVRLPLTLNGEMAFTNGTLVDGTPVLDWEEAGVADAARALARASPIATLTDAERIDIPELVTFRLCARSEGDFWDAATDISAPAFATEPAPPEPTKPAPPAPALEKGAFAILTGLQDPTRASLNGQCVKIIRWHSAKQRYVVRLSRQREPIEHMLICAVNLRPDALRGLAWVAQGSRRRRDPPLAVIGTLATSRLAARAGVLLIEHSAAFRDKISGFAKMVIQHARSARSH